MDHCLETGSQSLLLLSLMDMVTPQEKIKGHSQLYSSLEVRHPASSVPGNRHKGIPHPLLWNSTNNRLHTLHKGNSTKAYTTKQDTCSLECNNDKGTETKSDRQGGSRSEIPKYPAT